MSPTRRLPVYVAALVGLLTVAGAAAGSGGSGDGLEVHEVRLPKSAGTGELAAGRGGAWVADRFETRLLRIKPRAGKVSDRVRLDTTSVYVAISEGAAWVLSPSTVVRVDPKRAEVTDTIELPEDIGLPLALTAGGGGVWIVTDELEIVRVDPVELSAVTTMTLAGDASFTARRDARNDLAVGAGVLWARSPADGLLFRIDTAAGAATPIELGDGSTVRGGTGLAFGEGAVWAPRRGDELCRVDPAGGDPSCFDIGREGASVAAGQGAVWVVTTGRVVLRVDPDDRRVTDTIEPSEALLGAVAVGAGAVWVTDLGVFRGKAPSVFRIES
ncbi:MAG: hypothetical protein ACRDY4_09015 [Acidimicrobiia bacterium]